MHGKKKRGPVKLVPGVVNREDEHIQIPYGDPNEAEPAAFVPVALVMPGPGKDFTVEFTFLPDRLDEASPGIRGLLSCQPGGQPAAGVVNGEMHLNEAGEIARPQWLRTAQMRPNVELDAFTMMPNHLHGVVVIHEQSRDTLQRAPTQTE